MEESQLQTSEMSQNSVATPSQGGFSGAYSSSSGSGLEDLESPSVTPDVPNTGSVAAAKQPALMAFSKRKAMIVSIAITVAVTLLSGASILLLANKGPRSQQANQSAVDTQDVELQDAAISVAPAELQGANKSVLINADVVARGDLKIAGDTYSGTISVDGLTANRTYQLPDNSGTIATIEQVQALLGISVSGATVINEGDTIVATGVSSVNNKAGSLTLQGTSDQISIGSSGNTITLSTPQDIGILSNVQFGNLTLGTAGVISANTLQQTASGNDVSINAGANGITFYANGQSFVFPSMGGLGQTICTTGISCAAGGGQAVILAPNTSGSPTAQLNASPTLPSIFLNNTGGANLIQLQGSGSDRFIVNSSGGVTATSFDRVGSGALSIGTSSQTGLTIGRYAASTSIYGGTTSSINFNQPNAGTEGFYVDSNSNMCLGFFCGLIDTDASSIGIGSVPTIDKTITIGNGSNTTNINSGFNNINAGTNTITGVTNINTTGVASTNIGSFLGGPINLQNRVTINGLGDYETLGIIDSPYGGLGNYQNLLRYSETFNNFTAWGTTLFPDGDNGSVNPAPNQTSNADRLRRTAGGVDEYIYQTYSTSTTGNYTFSVWLRKESSATAATANIRIDTTGPSAATGTPTFITLDSTWRRYSVTQNTSGTITGVTAVITVTGPSLLPRTGAWGAQLEQGTSPGVYVRTSNTAVTQQKRGLVSNGGAYVSNVANDAVTLTIQAASSSQTADLLNVQSLSAENYFAVGATGTVTVEGLITSRVPSTSIGNALTLQPGFTNVTSTKGANLVLSGGGSGVGNGGGTRVGGDVTINGGAGLSNGGGTLWGDVLIGNNMTNGAITIGGNDMTATITLGNSIRTNTIDIGSRSNFANDSTQTINIGAITGNGSGSNSQITIGSRRLGSGVLIQSGSGGINIGTQALVGGAQDGTYASAIQIGNIGNAVTQSINIGNNATASSDTDLVVGSLIVGSTTLIQGGTGATAISLQAGSAGTITVGSAGVANTVIVGSTTGISSTTVRSGSGGISLSGATTASSTLVVQGTSVTVGTSGLQGSLILNDGNGQTATINTGDQVANRTVSIPIIGASDTFCLLTAANCVGTGGGVSGSGTSGILPLFTGTSSIGNSTLSQSGGNLTATGNITLQGGTATLGTSSQQGSLVLFEATGNGGQTATIRTDVQSADRVFSLPTVSADDVFCLAIAANCAGLATTTLQQAYGNDADGSDAVISLTSGDDSLVLSNPASLGSDSDFVLKVQQNATGARSGLLVTSAGDSSGYVLRVNDDGSDSDTTPFIVDNTGNVGIGDATPAALLTVGNGDLFQVDASGDITTPNGEDLSITTGTSGSLILNSGTTGTIYLGTTASAVTKTIRIGDNGNGTTNIAIGNTNLGTTTLNGASGITLTSATTLNSTLAVQGASVTVGGAAQAGSLYLYDGSSNTLQITSTSQTNNYAANVPTLVSADIFCMELLGNCAGLATTTLQGAYNNDADGSDAVISLSSGDDSLVISNPASLGSDSDFVLKVQQNATGAKSGLLVTSAGNTSGYALRVNDDGSDSDTTPFIVDNTGKVGIGTDSPNSLLTLATSDVSLAEFSIYAEDPYIDFHMGVSSTTLGGTRFYRSGVLEATVGFQNGINLETEIGAGSDGISIVSRDGGLIYLGSGNGDPMQQFRLSLASGIAFQAGGGTQHFTVDTSGNGYFRGNLGIGDTTPNAVLDVDAATTTTAAFGITDTGVHTGTGTNAVAFIQANSATSGDLLYVGSSSLTSGKALNITTSSTGFTGALAQFSSTGSGAGVTGDVMQVIMAGGGNTGTALNIVNAGDGFAFRVNDDGTVGDTTPFVIDASGRVGIGTANPTTLLEVGNGISLFTHALTTANGIDDAAIYLKSQEPVISFLDTTLGNTIGYYLEGTQSGSLVLGTGTEAGSISERVRFDAGGSVGIGDSTPASLFTVGNGDLFQVNSSGAIVAVTGITTSGGIVPNAGGTIDIGSAGAEFRSLYLGDDFGVVLGVNDDATLKYDEAGDDRVELTGSGASLFIEDKLGLGVQTLTLTDDGVANDTLTATATYVRIDIDETADGSVPALSISETGAKDGDILIIVNNETDGTHNSFTVTDSGTGVVVPGASITTDPNDVLMLIYVVDRWVTISYSEET